MAKHWIYKGILLVFLSLMLLKSYTQLPKKNSKIDSIASNTNKQQLFLKLNDSVKKKEHNPRKATRLSLFCPGLGQAYNRQYWKIPIAIAAVVIPTYLYLYYNSIYNKLQFAIQANNQIKLNNDSSLFKNIDPLVKDLSVNSLALNRTAFRQARDINILYFFLGWGLNVADATVSGHLKNFNVTNDISLHIEPTLNTNSFGIGLTFNFNFKSKNSFKTK